MITEKRKEQKRQYRINNKEKIARLSKIRYNRWIQKNEKDSEEYMKKYRQDWDKYHPNYMRDYKKKYRKDNADKIKTYKRKWENNRYKTDLKFNLNRKMGRAIHLSLKGNKAGRHWEILVGYACNDLVKHLRKTLPEGYTWNDYLQGKLHIDHKIPISAFNYTTPENPDFRECWALKNLQLLPARENLIKGSKLFKSFQPALKISLISKPTPIPA